MTLKSWKKEFYPKRPSKKMTRRGAIEHSLTKWIGLRKANLKKHNVELNKILSCIHDGSKFFDIDASTCALCIKYFSYDGMQEGCKLCPLYDVLGNVCDEAGSPYADWTSHQNPRPMITALRKALAHEK